MAEATVDLQELRRPFPSHMVSWRVVRGGKKGGKVWVRVAPYLKKGPIVARLDAVCGLAGWQVEFQSADAHLMAGIGIRIGEDWIWKWDGSGHLEPSDGLGQSDAGKGDFTNALKRAAWMWDIGRYLDGIGEQFATVYEDPRHGAHYGKLPEKKGGDQYSWDPPELPRWARPEDEPEPKARADHGADPETGEIPEEEADDNNRPFLCPRCGSECFDNRADKAAGRKSEKWPDLKCRDTRDCGWALWLDTLEKEIRKATNTAVIQGMPEEHEEHYRAAAGSGNPELMLRARAKLVELGALEEEEQPA